MQNKKQFLYAGFTLMELLITMAIIGILVAISVPSYQNYTRRAHFTEVVQATAPYKVGVEECYHLTGDLAACESGKHGIPKDIAKGKGFGLVESIAVKVGGIITVVPRDKYGIKPADTYELTPKIENERITWTRSGGGVDKGYASN